VEGVEEVKFVESYPISARIIQHHRKEDLYRSEVYQPDDQPAFVM
jgi:hypothetical protein